MGASSRPLLASRVQLSANLRPDVTFCTFISLVDLSYTTSRYLLPPFTTTKTHKFPIPPISSKMASLSPNPIQFQFRNPKAPFRKSNRPYVVVLSNLASSPDDSSKSALRISADSSPKARFVARRTESVSVRQLQRPLSNILLEILLFVSSVF